MGQQCHSLNLLAGFFIKTPYQQGLCLDFTLGQQAVPNHIHMS